MLCCAGKFGLSSERTPIDGSVKIYTCILIILNLLDVYTNIYIYIYMYVYMYVNTLYNMFCVSANRHAVMPDMPFCDCFLSMTMTMTAMGI